MISVTLAIRSRHTSPGASRNTWYPWFWICRSRYRSSSITCRYVTPPFLQKSFVVFNKPINLNDKKPIDQQIYPASLQFSLARAGTKPGLRHDFGDTELFFHPTQQPARHGFVWAFGQPGGVVKQVSRPPNPPTGHVCSQGSGAVQRGWCVFRAARHR